MSHSPSSSLPDVEQSVLAETHSLSKAPKEDVATLLPASQARPPGRHPQPALASSKSSNGTASTSTLRADYSVPTADDPLNEVAQLRADNAELRRRLELAEHQTAVWRNRFQILLAACWRVVGVVDELSDAVATGRSWQRLLNVSDHVADVINEVEVEGDGDSDSEIEDGEDD